MRDVRTLLLCKIKKDFQQYYRKIYAPAKVKPQTYMTLGGFEAINIYQTMPVTVSNQIGWAEQIYNDKVNIIEAMDENISYHPIHLISYSKSAPKFWATEKEKFPFFIVTFVYGVDGKKEVLLKNDDSSQSDSITSQRERVLLNYLRKKDDSTDNYMVYHAVNLSDLVIVWFTSDIAATLNKITGIEMEGVSRKTYSMVGLPLQDGTIPSYVEATAKADSKMLHLRVNGEIRDYATMQSLIESSNLPGALQGTKNFLTFGENDFSLLCRPVSDVTLVRLFQYWLQVSKSWEKACWAVRTDIWIELPSSVKPSQTKGFFIGVDLEGMFRKYREMYTKLKDFKWSSIFLELLSVYVNIEKNPVLHGPGDLVQGSVQIALAYFNGEVPGYESGSLSWQRLMENSQANIERFVRDWTQLTDQVTRIDDVMIHGLGDVVAIHNTLPEFVMDCYHSLMHRMVDILVLCDKKYGSINNNRDEFKYDFFFVPELNQRARISEMFKTSSVFCNESETGNVWPAKQAYIMEFPAPYIFRPRMFFQQLAHECFHCFGDVLRQRKQRAICMSIFMAYCFAFEIGCDSDNNNVINALIKHLLVTEEDVGQKFYLTKVVAALERKMHTLVSRSSISKVYDDAGQPYYLYDERLIDRWIKQEQAYTDLKANQVSFRSLLRVCAFLFKECYADSMMVTLLGMKPMDYLALFQDEVKTELMKYRNTANKMNDIDKHGNFYKTIQRIAAVLAACCSAGILQKTDCDKAIIETYESEAVDIRKTLSSVFYALYDGSITMPETIWLCPATALVQVIEYLKLAITKLQEVLRDPILSEKAENFRKTYKSVIEQENLFGKEFYEIIEG